MPLRLATLLAALTVGGTSLADASPPSLSVGALKLVATPLPYRRGPCAGNGVAYRNSAAEPTIATDPLRPSHLLAAWIAAPGYDRDDQAGAADLASRSDDGGRHWHLLVTRRSSQCNGGAEPKNADPAVAWARDGRSYLVNVAGGPEAGGTPTTRLELYRFAPSGDRSVGPIYLPTPAGFNDRPSITTDSSRPSRLEVIWTFRNAAPELDDIIIARSADRGRTWSARKIYTGVAHEWIWGVQLFHIGKKNRVVTYRSENGGAWRFYALRSSDAGHTWSGPERIGSVVPGFPQTGGRIVGGEDELATEASDGSVLVAWNRNTRDGRGHVLLSRTADGGGSWKVHTVADRPCATFYPAVAATTRGTIGISYDTWHGCSSGQGPQTDVRFAASTDAGRHWRGARLAGPYDMRNAISPEMNGRPFPWYFIGDYMGLSSVEGGFGAVFALTKPYARHGRQDIFFRRVKLR